LNFSVSLFVRRLGGYGSSSIGRVAVSKTVGCGFKSLLPCQSSLGEVKVGLEKLAGFGPASQSANGEVAEWSIAAVLKTALGESSTGVRIPPSPPDKARVKGKCAELRLGKLEKIVNDLTKILIWVVVIGALFSLLWWQGQIRALSLYIQETREELRKCSWPTWEELKGSTALVIVSIGLLGAFTVAVDFAMNLVLHKL
jgi:preprotein translocase subunit SecE